jgi:hypothetical protein
LVRGDAVKVAHYARRLPILAANAKTEADLQHGLLLENADIGVAQVLYGAFGGGRIHSVVVGSWSRFNRGSIHVAGRRVAERSNSNCWSSLYRLGYWASGRR